MADSKISWWEFMGGAAVIGVIGAGQTYYLDTLPYLRCAGKPCRTDLPHYAERLQATHAGAATHALWSFAILMGMAAAAWLVLMVVNGVRDAERGDRERFEQRENGPDRPVP